MFIIYSCQSNIVQILNWMRQLFSEKSVFGTSSDVGLKTVTLSAAAVRNDRVVTCEALRILTAEVTTHSEIVCVPLFCTRPSVPCGCHLG